MGRAVKLKRQRKAVERLFSKSNQRQNNQKQNPNLLTFGDLSVPFFEKYGKGAFINTPGKPFLYALISNQDIGDAERAILTALDPYKSVLVGEALYGSSIFMFESFPVNDCPIGICATKNDIEKIMEIAENLVLR